MNGLDDGQREPAKGGIVNPQTWRVIDAGSCDWYIPIRPQPERSRALLQEIAQRMGYGSEVGDK